jgi:hypothetical protein
LLPYFDVAGGAETVLQNLVQLVDPFRDREVDFRALVEVPDGMNIRMMLRLKSELLAKN